MITWDKTLNLPSFAQPPKTGEAIDITKCPSTSYRNYILFALETQIKRLRIAASKDISFREKENKEYILWMLSQTEDLTKEVFEEIRKSL